ncbi:MULTISPECIES: hypothetical protein [unclassified Bacillus (in: firmicutes)]|uniref:hypothetical protein n=1 Tax=unclassified Bacillus (in: firmicutes) TaxID=185979 RepID=UPI001BE8229D|nr:MULTISPECIES: hypothetical protein [unclassified Bacillus (in: firmicutes)]MBT2638323.1 hypothetical protein [Bacillus sp. ISL-39]MBT2661321.1 hypothetical protein [Bacillus sp. ISL-45]
MQLLLISITIINFSIGAWLYYVLRKSRFLFSDRFGYTASYFASSILGLVASLNFMLLFPNHFGVVGVLNILLGITIGFLYGSMFNAQSLIAGIYNGGISAIMGTMLGLVVKNPAICGLPGTIASEQEMIIFFALFSLCIQGISALLLQFSFKV